MLKLSDQQINSKLIEGRNYKRLYLDLKLKYDKLSLENKQLKQDLLDQRLYFESIVETQAAQISELQTMVFGRNKHPRSGGGHTVDKPTRAASSYRRALPPTNESTTTQHHSISTCRHCGGLLSSKEEHIRYVEDIVLAALSESAQFTTLQKQTIERGYCVPCGKYSSAQDLRGQQVTIGPVVRSLICYLITLRDHSYAQVQSILWDIYRFKITDGEIANILATRRLELLPAYEQLKNNIRASPAIHMDESRWRIQSEQSGYAWSMSSTSSSDVVFRLADSRGMGNAQDLLGEHYHGVGITDRYPGYKNLFKDEDGNNMHQICWSHLQRTAKDLTHLGCLSIAKQKNVARFYHSLASIYSSIRDYQLEPYDEARRQTQASLLLKQIKLDCTPTKLDPKKLFNLKAGILEYQDCLFLCLTIDGIPADNNRAERDIKQLVIKRRKSLGSKTTKGARTLEVLLSVCVSLYNRDKDNFFRNFHTLTT
jgi:transposase